MVEAEVIEAMGVMVIEAVGVVVIELGGGRGRGRGPPRKCTHCGVKIIRGFIVSLWKTTAYQVSLQEGKIHVSYTHSTRP